MNWNLTENGNTLTPGNYLIGAIYDPSAPTVVVQSVVLPGPYTSPINFSFTGIAEQVWLFILWENTTPTVGGISRSTFSLQPTQNNVQVRADLCLKAGSSVNMAVGANSYVADSPNDLTGWQYDIERKPQGTQFVGETVAIDTNGFHLLVAGDIFGEDEEFVLHFLPKVAATVPPPVTTGIIVSAQVITGTITLDNTFTGKTGLIQGSASSLIITLPALSTMAASKVIGFISRGGSHINAVLQCVGGDTILWSNGPGGTPSQIVLGQNEQIQLFKNGSVWEVLSVSDTVRMVGEILYDYMNKLNTVLANGNKLSRTIYVRLWNYVQSLPSSQIVVDSAWANSATKDGVTFFPNKGKYTLGDGSTTFGIPQLYNYGFLRAVDGSTRNPGDFQVDALLSHKHDTLIGEFTGTPNGVGPSKSGGGYKGTFTQPTDLTDTPFTPSGTKMVDRISTETRPVNTGVFALIRI